MPSEVTIMFLLKFGKIHDMTRLLKEGMVYAKPLVDFKKDIKHDRYDVMEGLFSSEHFKKGTVLSIKAPQWDNYKTLPWRTGQLNRWLNASCVHNYSMVAITEKEARENEVFEIPEGMKTFGDTFVIIKSPGEFIERFDKALFSADFKFKRGLVTYYDSSLDQKNLGYFHKSIEHSYEREYRVLIENDSNLPTELFLGSLEDIAELNIVSQYKGLKFEWR